MIFRVARVAYRKHSDNTARLFATYNIFRTARTTETGKPVFYTMDGSNFKFGPRPDTTYTGKLLYYAAPDF